MGILAIIWNFWMIFHPLYLSNTAVRYQADQERIYLRFQIFEEDLDAILQVGYNATITDEHNPKLMDYIHDYIFDNFHLKVDGKEMNFEDFDFLKKSKQYDSIILEYEKRGVKAEPKNLEVEITFLLEMFPEQTNIVSFSVGKSKKSFPLKEYNTKAVFNTK